MSDDTPKDRLKETIKSPYNEEGDVWNALLEAFGQEFDSYEETIENVNQNKFVDTADEGSLENLASIFDIQRRTDEPVREFRARLKTALRSQISSATISEIKEVISVILDKPLDEIDIIEPSEFSPAFIELAVDTGDFDTSAFLDIVEQLTAAGVDVGIRVLVDAEDALRIDSVVDTDTPLDSEGFSLSDAVSQSPPSIVEPASFADSTNTRADTTDQSHWNEGIWNIDHYDTALVRFTLNFDELVALSDEATTDFPTFDPKAILEDVVTTDFPDPEPTTVIDEETNHRVDIESQGFWSSGKWNIDHFDTFTIEFTITYDDSVGISDAVAYPSHIEERDAFAAGDSVDYPSHIEEGDSQSFTDSAGVVGSEEVRSGVWTHSTWTTIKGTSVWGERDPPDSIPHFYANPSSYAIADVVETDDILSIDFPSISDVVSTNDILPTSSPALSDVVSFDDVSPDSRLSPSDEQRSHATRVVGGVWNDAKWQVDHYGPDEIVAISLAFAESLSVRDTALLPAPVTGGDSIGATDDVALPAPVESTEGVVGGDSTVVEAEPVRSAVWTHSTWSVPKGTSVWGVSSPPKSIPHTYASDSVGITDGISVGSTDVSDAFWGDASYNSSVTVWA